MSIACRSQTFADVLFASLLLGKEGNWTTYKTTALHITVLMDLLRNGCTFGEESELYMNAVSVPNDINGGTDTSGRRRSL